MPEPLNIDITLIQVSDAETRRAFKVFWKRLETETQESLQRGYDRAAKSFHDAAGRPGSFFQRAIEKSFVSAINRTVENLSKRGAGAPAGRGAAGTGAVAAGPMVGGELSSEVRQLVAGVQDITRALADMSSAFKKVSVSGVQESLSGFTKGLEDAAGKAVESEERRVKSLNAAYLKAVVPEELASSAKRLADAFGSTDLVESLNSLKDPSRGKAMQGLVDEFLSLSKKVKDLDDILERSAKMGLEREQVLSTAQRDRLALIDKEREAVKKRIQAMAVGAGEGSPLMTERGMLGGLAGKAGSFAAGLPMAALVTVGNLLGSIVGAQFNKLKDTLWGARERERSGLMAAPQMFSAPAMTSYTDLAADFATSIKNAIETNPVLKMYGGENAFQSFLMMKRSGGTGYFGTETLSSPTAMREAFENIKDGLVDMTAKATLAASTMEIFAKTTADATRYLGMNQKGAEEFTFSLLQQEKDQRLEMGSLIGQIRGVNSTMRRWGHTQYESIGIATHFAKAVEQGRISLQSLVEAAMAPNRMTEGQRVFMLDRFRGAGGTAGQFAQGVSGMNPLEQSLMFKKAVEGALSKGEIQSLGFSKNTSADRIRTDILKATYQEARKMAVEHTGAGASTTSIESFTREFFKTLIGLDLKSMTEREIAIIEGTYGAGKIVAGGGGRGRAATAGGISKEDVEEFKKTLSEKIGPIEKATLAAEEVYLNFGQMVLDAASTKKFSEELGASIDAYVKGKPGDLLERIGVGTKGDRSMSLSSGGAESYLELLLATLQRPTVQKAVRETDVENTLVIPLASVVGEETAKQLAKDIEAAIKGNDKKGLKDIISGMKRVVKDRIPRKPGERGAEFAD